jgi:hypothetical protein
MILLEGGNVFKDQQQVPLTQRINRVDVPTTIVWLEQTTGLKLHDAMVGSTGVTETSGDIDLLLDANVLTKDAVMSTLFNWCKHKGIPEEEIMNRKAKGKQPAFRAGWIDQTGIEVHFRTPINGNTKNGFVQTDFNFVHKIAWSRFMLAAMPASSAFKGVDRAVLFNSIGKILGVKVTVHTGVHDRLTDELVTDDPAKMAEMFLPAGTVRDLASVESIIGALRNDPQRDAKLRDFQEYLARSNRQLPQLESSAHPSEWFRHLNNRLR